MLDLQAVSCAIIATIKCDGAFAKPRANFESALERCEEVEGKIQGVVYNIDVEQNPNETPTHTVASKVRAFGRKAIYPIKKEKTAGFASAVKNCRDTMGLVLTLL